METTRPAAQGRRLKRWTAVASLCLAFGLEGRAQVSLYTTVDMALRNSTGVRLATADVLKARAALEETRDVYIPSVNFGSSLGPPSYGFPTGLPSIFNISGQSFVFSFSQRDYIRAARAGLRASELALKDARQQVVLDAVIDYIHLDKLSREAKVMEEEGFYVDKLLSIEQERIAAGLDSRNESLKAQLTAAQLRLKRIHLEGEIDGVQQQLAHLTGLPARGFIPCADCIPPPPELRVGNSRKLPLNLGVQAAYTIATSRQYQAFGDKRQNLRPQLSFGAQYNRYASFNNFADYYKHFQHNSFGAGIQMVLPIFDQSHHAKEHLSAAEASHAAAEADQARDRSDEQLSRLQSSLGELSAQQEVAGLQQQLAQEQLDALRIQLESSSSAVGAVPLTPKDEQLAHIQERQRYEDLLETKLELLRAQLGMLRLTGDLEDWVKQSQQH